MSPEPRKPEVVNHPHQPVHIAAIEHALAQLWKHLDPSDAKHAELTRACMSNLIVFCPNQNQANIVLEDLGEIVRLHPSRVLLLIGDTNDPSSTIEAFVSAICHISGSHGQVCSEHVTISATGNAVQRLPSTARSLLIGDLPTSLWWANQEAPSLGGDLFTELEAMADQVIYSSLGWRDPARDTIATARWAIEAESTETMPADLAWRRLKPWRSLIGQSLDPNAMPKALESITNVTVEYGQHGLSQAWLLIGWLAFRLGWQPSGSAIKRGDEWRWMLHASGRTIEARTKLIPEGDPRVQSAVVAWRTDGTTASMTVSTQTPGKLSMCYEGVEAQPRVLVTPNQSRSTLVGLQLQDLERDYGFEGALQIARLLAEASAGR